MFAWINVALLTPILLCALLTDAGTEQTKALAAIKKLGGKLQTEESGRVVGIDLSGTQASDDDLKLLSGFKTLRTLNLFNTKITGPGLAHLKGLDRLEELDLSWPLLGYADAVGDSYRPRPLDEKSLKHLNGLPALHSLNLQYTRIGEEGLQHLGGLKTLRELDLGLAQVTDKGLRHLQGLTELTRLNLRNDPVSDRSAATLGRLAKLRELDLGGTRIGDAGLRQLKRLAFLEELDVSGTRVTDAGLKHLRELTTLRELWLSQDAEFTDRGIAQLRTARPRLRVYQNVFIPSRPSRAASKAEDGVKVRGTVSVLIAANRPGEKVKKAVAGAAVHLRDLPKGRNPKPPAEPVVLHFRKGRIYPEFACLAVGQRLIVRAEDGERFALRATSRARGEFGALLPPNDREFTDSFPKPDDFVSLTCALHATAKAHLQVVPTPIFALCDAEGKFTLPERLPKGQHVLRAFFPGVGWGEKAIALQGDEGEVVVELELAPRSKVQTPHGKQGLP